MLQKLESTISLLTSTPRVIDALLRRLPECWTLADEGPGTWTAYDVVGHLNHCERADWLPRLKIVLKEGESRPFSSLDRLAQRHESAGKPLTDLLDEFSHLREENLSELEGLRLTPQELALRGTHPAFGAVTVAELLAAWTVHDLTHLHQLSRILAHQYRDAVGPWSAYLGVLRCSGHSS